ncbi:MAG: NAD-dependent DNA ligase LigA [Anaerovoracaceae bacterium]
MKDIRKDILERIEYLNKAAKAYYKEDREIISNFEYDKLYDELVNIEAKTGIIMSNSPTQNVGYEVLESLPKEAHLRPMLSLGKTKEISELAAFLKDKEGVLSFKLDGLTIVLTYKNGVLEKAVTRGNGEIGEVVTSNAKVFVNLPLIIPHKGDLVLRGEAYIKYSDFEKINEEIPEMDAKYKNPRNLCSGSVRQLNSQITAERRVNFQAFSVSESEGLDFGNSRDGQFKWLKKQGFEVVDYKLVNKDNIEETVKQFAGEIPTMDIPSDGLVLSYDDIAYGEGLGETAKAPRHSIAFKWQDEIKETTLEKIEWSASRTGLINPVAIFDSVQLEGTTVSRASVHNVSIVKSLQLGIGDTITVYKANMIIPQIADNLTRSDNIEIPKECTVCGGKTIIKADGDVEVLYCTNPDCPAKKIKAFGLFVSRNGMNIESLSESTLEKFISEGIIKSFPDLYEIAKHENKIVGLSGFGQKSYDNLIKNIKKSKNTTVARLLYSLGIPGIGTANAKIIAVAFDQDMERIINATEEQLMAIDGIGQVMASDFANYMALGKNRSMVELLLSHLILVKEEKIQSEIEDKTFVITGSLVKFENRNQLKEEIEKRGGKVSGSVSSKTHYLINNDVESSSSKNKKAKELGVPIITEEAAMKMMDI